MSQRGLSGTKNTPICNAMYKRRSSAQNENTHEQGNGGNERRAELEAPGDLGDFEEDQVGGEPEEDSEGGPQLPRHYQAATNSGRCVLSSEDGDGGSLHSMGARASVSNEGARLGTSPISFEGSTWKAQGEVDD